MVFRIVLVKDCDDCPYHNSYSTYMVECVLQEDKYGLCRQVSFKDCTLMEANDRLLRNCPLMRCDDNDVMNYYKSLDEDLL